MPMGPLKIVILGIIRKYYMFRASIFLTDISMLAVKATVAL